MPDSHLPENLSDWPSDPHALLGVAPGVAPRDLKRAYAKLLKQYKPEQYPEHFRRIREAYETLQRFAEWEERFKSMQADLPTADEQPIADTPPPQHLPMPQRVVSEPGLPTPDQAWRLARQGDMATAYQQLRDWQQRYPRDEDAYLRLYWVLWMRPELDAARKPCQWLLVGLHEIGSSCRLSMLLAQELEDTPKIALADAYERLMAQVTNDALYHELLELRWHAAERLQRVDICFADLNDCRERLLKVNEVLWVRTLLRCADLLAWETEDTLQQFFQRVVHECRQFGHLAFTLGDEYDRLDLLSEIAKQWPRAVARRELPPELIRLIPHSWIRPDQDLLQDLAEIGEKVVREPGAWLHSLDVLHQAAPTVLSALGRYLHQLDYALASQPHERHQPVIAGRLLATFLQRQGDTEYRKLRARLLRFCMEENLAPYQLAEIAEPYVVSFPNGLAKTLDQAVMEDAPFCCVFRLYEVFWQMC